MFVRSWVCSWLDEDPEKDLDEGDKADVLAEPELTGLSLISKVTPRRRMEHDTSWKESELLLQKLPLGQAHLFFENEDDRFRPGY